MAAPIASIMIMLLMFLVQMNVAWSLAAAVALAFSVFSAVYHAEVVAHRLGEPFGTLVLAVAVTVIEVALIVSVLVSDPVAKAGVARDTVFAAVMIVCNGIVGICLLVGGMRHRVQDFRLEGASAALAVLAALTTLTLVVPNVTLSTPGPTYTTLQLGFVGIASLVLYCAFVFIQTIRHRDFFLPTDGGEDAHAAPPSVGATWASIVLLILALVAVVGLAKSLTPALETAIEASQAHKSVVGIVIAALVLTPEGLAAVRAARANRLQTSLNLALGSALATIGLTIPVVAAVSILIRQPLQLGIDSKDLVLLSLTIVLGVITLGTGRTTVLQGIVHLVVFAAFLLFAFVP